MFLSDFGTTHSSLWVNPKRREKSPIVFRKFISVKFIEKLFNKPFKWK